MQQQAMYNIFWVSKGYENENAGHCGAPNVYKVMKLINWRQIRSWVSRKIGNIALITWIHHDEILQEDKKWQHKNIIVTNKYSEI